MEGELVIVRTDGMMSRSKLTKPPTLETLQRAVGGYIEAVPYFLAFEGKTCVAFCNEEGKLINLPVNVLATNLWHAQRDILDVLVGDVVVIVGDKQLLGAV